MGSRLSVPAMAALSVLGGPGTTEESTSWEEEVGMCWTGMAEAKVGNKGRMARATASPEMEPLGCRRCLDASNIGAAAEGSLLVLSMYLLASLGFGDVSTAAELELDNGFSSAATSTELSCGCGWGGPTMPTSLSSRGAKALLVQLVEPSGSWLILVAVAIIVN